MDPGFGMPPPRGPPIDPRKARAPRALVMLTLLLLALEFLFGVIWSTWPGTAPSSVTALFGSSAGSYGYLSAHAFVAVLLVLSSLAVIVFIQRLHRPPLLIASAVGFLLIVAAALSGSALLSTQNNDFVVLMAIFFLGAWSLYVMLSFRLRALSRMARFRANWPDGPPPP